MPRTTSAPKAETFTFRLDSALKSALTRSAEDERLQPGELLRRLVRAHLAAKSRRRFELEARRQSLSIARRADDPTSDEAQFMRELEADLERAGLGDEWKA